MHFTSILTGFVVLLLGSPDPAVAFNHWVAQFLTNTLTNLCVGLNNPATQCSNRIIVAACTTQCATVAVPACPDPVTPVVACPVPVGWSSNNGNCYYFSEDASAVKANWKGAYDACQKLGTNVGLAELGDPANLKSDAWLMKQIDAKGDKVWLGANVPTRANKYRWTGGEPPLQVWNGPAGSAEPTGADVYKWVREGRELSLEAYYWATGQPNNSGGKQNCLTTIKESNDRHYFNDGDCTKDIYHYVCQRF